MCPQVYLTLTTNLCKSLFQHTHTHTHTNKEVSYATDAFVFDVKKLLLRELHMQEILED